MTELMFDYVIVHGEYVIRLVLSVLCGYLIGYERKNRNKEAGIRTHIIVCMASCLMMEISKYGFGDIAGMAGDMRADGSRIASQIVSGIGFLGAGMIFVHKNSIKGLTTAAGIWATSGIGMAIGAGMYFIGIITTLLIVILQIVLHTNLKLFRHKMTETLVFEIKNSMGTLDKIPVLLKDLDIHADNISMKKISDEKMLVTADVTYDENISIFDICRKAIEYDDIYSVYVDSQ